MVSVVAEWAGCQLFFDLPTSIDEAKDCDLLLSLVGLGRCGADLAVVHSRIVEVISLRHD